MASVRRRPIAWRHARACRLAHTASKLTYARASAARARCPSARARSRTLCTNASCCDVRAPLSARAARMTASAARARTRRSLPSLVSAPIASCASACALRRRFGLTREAADANRVPSATSRRQAQHRSRPHPSACGASRRRAPFYARAVRRAPAGGPESAHRHGTATRASWRSYCEGATHLELFDSARTRRDIVAKHGRLT